MISIDVLLTFPRPLLTIALSVSLCACASTRLADEVEVFISPIHKSAATPQKKPSDDETRPEYVFQFVDNDGNAYVTRWQPKPEHHAPFSEVRTRCLEASQESLKALVSEPISAVDADNFTPDNYKTIVQCIFDNGFMLLGGDSFYPDMYSLVFARPQQDEQGYAALGGRYYILKSSTAFATLITDARTCELTAVQQLSKVDLKDDWQANYAAPFKEAFINCLVSHKYRVAQN